MSGCFRPPIAVSGRTGRRIGQTARRHNHAVCLYPFPIGKLQTDCLPVLFQNPLHAAVQMDLHALSAAGAPTRGSRPKNGRIPGTRGCRVPFSMDTPPAPKGASPPDYQTFQTRCIKTSDSLQPDRKDVPAAVICHIAAPFSGNIDFLAQFFIFFIKRHLSAGFCRRISRHHSGCPAADYRDIFFQSSVSFGFKKILSEPNPH